jgi:uncharacterized metal-binding protein YceD (DUF177 family)
MSASEFSRPHRLDQIGAGESRVSVTAEPEERAALAARFGLVSVEALGADYALRRDAAGIIATGHLSARVVQSCVVTEEPLAAGIEENFTIRFVPEPEDGAEEVELNEDECDTVFYTGSAIDLGEAAAETLVLALDPFPRSPSAEAKLKEAGVLSEEEAGPFGALAALKDKLGKG